MCVMEYVVFLNCFSFRARMYVNHFKNKIKKMIDINDVLSEDVHCRG